jgi:hypothetical protein
MKQRSEFFAFLLVLALVGGHASAVTPAEAHRNAIAWLETHQNRDGSWGSGLTRPVATAEALLALAKAGRPRSPAAQKAAAWLLTRSYAALDHRARAVRALAAAGFPVVTLSDFGAIAAGTTGWGPLAIDAGVTSYDSALVMAAIYASGQEPDVVGPVGELIDRRRTDGGWSGDDVPHSPTAKSDLTVTAEIVRALTEVDGSSLTPSILILGGGVPPTTSTLEIAARLAALHAYGSQSDPIEQALLNRMSGGSWGADPLETALGLLAISTRPGRTLGGGPADNDDGDPLPNASDAFPQNGAEWLDSDGDGIGDNADADDDGDGVCEGGSVQPGQCVAANDAFPLDPREWADTDGDGNGNNVDVDTDGDGVPDDAELATGSDPLDRDTDGDGLCDGPDAVPPCTGADDPCPTVAFASDLDGDLVCSNRDACDLDPTDWRDTDDDDVCDVSDDDDDGDGFSDAEELAAGTDRRNDESMPSDLATTDPSGDFDGDGLANASEENVHGTNVFLADTDQDGATDFEEVSFGSATNAAVRPVAAPNVFAVFGAYPLSGPAYVAEASAAGALRGTGTGGQSTPVARLGSTIPAAGPGYENLAGYQAQCTIGRDVDGDGLSGLAEATRHTAAGRADTDKDGFADGAGGLISVAGYTGLAWDLQPEGGDGFMDGEDEFDTDPTDGADHPGMGGDVAPLGRPDGRITAADASVEIQIVTNPSRTAGLSGQNKEIADRAADANGDTKVDVRDALEVVKEAASAP